MTHGHYPNDMGLLAIGRVCQAPVAVPWHSSQGVDNDVMQMMLRIVKKKIFLQKLQDSGYLRCNLFVQFYP